MKVELLKWEREYSAELCRICNGADRRWLSGRLPYPYTQANADWWLGQVEEREGKSALFRAIVVDGSFAGNISVEQKEDVYCKDAELGYLLLDSFKSRGVMTQAVSQICALAFESLDILRISANVYQPNAASRRVLEKNGFELEGLMKKAVWKDGELYDLCIYGKCL